MLDLDPVVAPIPRLDQFPADDRPLQASVDPDGGFVIDLGEFFDARSRPWRELPSAFDVIANDPLYMPVRQRALVSIEEPRGPSPSRCSST